MIQVHLLTAYPATLLNRDDAGFAKRTLFGGAWRTRISSQCLKKHWRDEGTIKKLGNHATRSRLIYERKIAQHISAEQREKEGKDRASEGEARQIAQYLLDVTLSKSEKRSEGEETEKKRGKKEEAAEIETGQVVVLTHAEVAFLQDVAERMLKELRSSPDPGSQAEDRLHQGFFKYLDEQGILGNLKIKASVEDLKAPKKRTAFLRKIRDGYFAKLTEHDGGASLDTAMFGRMVTSDLFSRVDAAIGVAHAFTTHAEQKGVDYFTAVDSLKDDSDDAGAGLIQETELTTGVFYTYVVIDMVELRRNLGAQADLAEELTGTLVRAMATVSPGAKQGSTAPFSYAEMILLERGAQQPRTLANAFLQPVRANNGSLMAESVGALLTHRAALEAMYEPFEGKEALATIHDAALPKDIRSSLKTVSLKEAIHRVLGEG
ncbi:MAG: type I-E CRISPR-associated protein Cas7/Cse4/CasC [Gemmatimonadetes bacterium]|nr:type I-E CRISPR-associated protein Cas7/Cse4/CasC [Gemmatimonadota bacterium]